MPAKTIALVEWNWMGHHPVFFKLFIRALLELGCTVVAFCPKPDEVESFLAKLDENLRSRLFLRALAWANAPRRVPRRWARRAATTRSLYHLRKGLREWEAKNQRAIDLVFFACIYDFQFQSFRNAEWLFPYRWSGLYLHCRAFRKPGSAIPQTGELPCPERFFRSPKLHSIAVLDEGATGPLKELSGKSVVVFPDLTDEDVSATPGPLALKLKQFASGAPIVGSLGQLQPTKGVTTLAHLALDSAYRDVVFAFIGDVAWTLFKPEEQVLMSSLAERCPNVFTHYHPVYETGSFNSAFQACDLIYAAYLDFPNSSNILTKAALLEKPVIVSDGFLMAERVREYRMGEIIREGDLQAAGEAIRNILQNPKGWVERCRPRWRDYRQQHSFPILKASFATLLAQN